MWKEGKLWANKGQADYDPLLRGFTGLLCGGASHTRACRQGPLAAALLLCLSLPSAPCSRARQDSSLREALLQLTTTQPHAGSKSIRPHCPLPPLPCGSHHAPDLSLGDGPATVPHGVPVRGSAWTRSRATCAVAGTVFSP